MATTRNPTLLHAITVNRDDAVRLAQTNGYKDTLALLKRADAELAQRLRLARGLQGEGKDTFTARQAEIALKNIRDVTRQVQRSLLSTVQAQGTKAADLATGNMLDYMERANRQFKGLGEAPLPIKEAGMLTQAKAGVNASILRRLTSEDTDETGTPKQGILARYGALTVASFEEELSLAVLTGKSWEDTRNSLIGKSPFLQSKPAFWADRIVRTECLTGDTLVSGAMVRAVFRRWYDGDVIEVSTKRGRKFTTTPNHPMLTRRGWVSSGDLQKGDNLICYIGDQHPGSPGNEDVAAPPTTIGEIFDSLSTVWVNDRVRTRKPDFHGDGKDGYVNTLTSGGMLGIGSFAPIYQPLANDILSPPYLSTPAFCGGCRRLLSVDKQACLCGVPANYTGLLQSALDSAVSCLQTMGDGFSAFPSLIALYDFVNWQIQCARVPQRIESVRSRFSPTSHHSHWSQEPLDRFGGSSTLLSGGIGAKPGEIEFDTVCEVRIKRFSGHVYNLSTRDGYFAINGAYTGNTIAAYNRAGYEVINEANEQLGDMVKILAATFDDRTGWDSYQVHGQIRRPNEAFQWGGGFFQSPPNRPNDREIVVPHRVVWPIPAYLRWRSDGEVTSQYFKHRRTGSPGPRPPMTTIPLELFGKEQPKKDKSTRVEKEDKQSEQQASPQE